MKQRLFLTLLLTSLVLVVLPDVTLAEVRLPNWANAGNLDAELSSKGQNVADSIALIVGILAVIGMLVGAGYFAMQRSDLGKQWLGGGAVGLVVAGSVYSIAALFV